MMIIIYVQSRGCEEQERRNLAGLWPSRNLFDPFGFADRKKYFGVLFFPTIFRADGNLTDSKRQHGKNGKNISFQRWRNFLSQEIATHRSLRFLFTWCACRFEGTLFIHYSIEYDFNSFDFNLAKNNKSSWRKKSILRTVEHELLVLCFRTSNCQFVKIEKCSCLKKLRGKQDRISFSILYLDLRLNE